MNQIHRIAIVLGLIGAVLTAGPAFGADKAPVCGGDKPVEVATCKDGKVMCAKTDEHRGACSGHGGVANWADGSEVKSHARKTDYK